MIKMVVTDLDDTLLRTDKTISEFSRQILQETRQQGIKVIFATGRGASAKILLDNGLFDGRVLMNGAKAYVGERLVHKALIPAALFVPFLQELAKQNLRVSAEIEERHYANFNVQELWPYVKGLIRTDFVNVEESAEKLCVLVDDSSQVELIRSLLPKGLYMHFSRDGLAMIMQEKATKLNGIMKIADEFAIQAKEIVAFGDDVNDEEMLKELGLGVAMGNAIEELKKVADTFCGHNDQDGVANWLHNNLNKSKQI